MMTQNERVTIFCQCMNACFLIMYEMFIIQGKLAMTLEPKVTICYCLSFSEMLTFRNINQSIEYHRRGFAIFRKTLFVVCVLFK